MLVDLTQTNDLRYRDVVLLLEVFRVLVRRVRDLPQPLGDMNEYRFDQLLIGLAIAVSHRLVTLPILIFSHQSRTNTSMGFTTISSFLVHQRASTCQRSRRVAGKRVRILRNLFHTGP